MALKPIIPSYDTTRLDAIGRSLSNKFNRYKTMRKPAEDKWIENLRQYRGIYDETVKIPKGQSRAYPKLTRWKTVATVARLMAMLFPQQEKNWELQPSAIASLSVQKLQEILDTLTQQNATAAQASGQPPAQLTREQVQKAVQDDARRLAENMAVKVADDLQEADYEVLARQVVLSATMYGLGVLKGPTLTEVEVTDWNYDATGRPVAITKKVFQPEFEYLPNWVYYPDMTAMKLPYQDGTFERHIKTKDQVKELADQPGFLKERVLKFLKDRPNGNHTLLPWETDLRYPRKSDRNQVQNNDDGKYEVLCYYGPLTGEDLRAVGGEVRDEDIAVPFRSVVWMLETTVISMAMLPIQDARMHHEFIFEEDDLSLLGIGLPDILRDSQISLCEATRALLDESSVLGTDIEINIEKLIPGHDTDRSKNKAWLRNDEGASANVPAIRPVPMGNNLQQILAMLQVFTDFADKESSLPPASMGDVSGGGSEALRTTGNVSMIMGAASLPIRDTVRNFDAFTISVISSLVKWNMKFAPDPDRDGDSNVIARGSTSLIAKEVLANALNQLRASVTPAEAPNINDRKLLIERMKATDLPIDSVLETEDVAAKKAEAQQQQTQQQQELANQEVMAKTRQMLADSQKQIAQATQIIQSIPLDKFKAVAEALQNDQANSARAGAPASTGAA